MNRRIVQLCSLAVIFLLVGFGCKGLSEEEKASIEPVVLDYWTVFNDTTILKNFANEYKALRPYVTINIKKVRYEEFDKLFVNALADDVAPDLISVHTQWLGKYQNRLAAMPSTITVADVQVKGQYAKEVIVTPQQKLMPSPRSIQTQYVSTVFEDVHTDGELYGLPLALDTLAIYYNKDLLDAAGIPEAPTTWEQFLDAVKAGTKFDASGNIRQSGVALGTAENILNAPDILAMLMMQNQQPITIGTAVTFAEGLQKPTPEHPALESLRFYTDYARSTKEAYSWNEDQVDALEAFTRGQSVFYFGYAFDASRIATLAPQLNIEVIPVPQLNPGQPANVANYWIEAVVHKTEAPNEAWDFIRYMSVSENVARYTQATGQPSPLRAQIAEQLTDPVVGPFASQVLTAKNWYTGKDIDAANDAIRDMISSYLEPYTEEDKPLRRDAGIVTTAARIIQQTMR